MIDKTILQITSMDSTKFGALEKYFLELIKYSENKKLKMIIQYNHLPRSESYLNELKTTDVDIRITPLNKNSIVTIINAYKLIKTNRPEIIHCHFINRNLKIFIPVFCLLFRVKKLYYTIHGSIDFKKYRYIRFFLNRFDAFFPVSQEIYNRILNIGINNKKIFLNYLGLVEKPINSIELHEKYRNKFGINKNSTVLACIAFDEPIKGVDILLKAFSKVVKEQKNIVLLLIGIDPRNSNLFRLSKELCISQFVHWVGITDKASEILNAADIYVQPSRSEGLGLAILEAMAQKLPVLATNVGGVPEAVLNKKTGLLVEPNSENELYKGILFFIKNQDKRVEMGKKGYEHYINIFDGKKSIKNLVDNFYINKG